MEQEGRGKRSANQLQGTPVQDQTIRSVSTGSRVGDKKGDEESGDAHRVVIRYESHAIRGFAETKELGSVEQLLRNDNQYPLETIRLKLLDSDTTESFPTKDA